MIHNPDGHILNQRANGNNFDLNRDWLTQSQPETKATVPLIQEWLSPELLDQHGYVTPTLIEATTKPHNPGIEYDFWLKWNQARIDANEAAMNAIGLGVTRPINDWCSEGDPPDAPGGVCVRRLSLPGRPPPRAGTYWGPFYTPMYSQLVGLNGSTVEGCKSTRRTRQPVLPAAPPDPAKDRDRLARAAHVTATVDARVSTSRTGRSSGTTSSRSTAAASPTTARPPCCPAPFDVNNNWMHGTPTRLRHPRRPGPAQRRRGEPARRVAVLQRHRVRELRANAVRSRPERRARARTSSS